MGQIHKLCSSGEIQKIKKLLRSNPALINELDEETQISPLCLALENGHLAIAQFLLRKEAKVICKKEDEGYESILYWTSNCPNPSKRIAILNWLKENAKTIAGLAKEDAWFIESIDLILAMSRTENVQEKFNLIDQANPENVDGIRAATGLLFLEEIENEKSQDTQAKITTSKKILSCIENISHKTIQDYYYLSCNYLILFKNLEFANENERINALENCVKALEQIQMQKKLTPAWAEDCANGYAQLSNMYMMKEESEKGLDNQRRAIATATLYTGANEVKYSELIKYHFDLLGYQISLGQYNDAKLTCEQVMSIHDGLKQKSEEDYRIIAVTYANYSLCLANAGKENYESVIASYFEKSIRTIQSVIRSPKKEKIEDRDWRCLAMSSLNIAKYYFSSKKINNMVKPLKDSIEAFGSIKNKSDEDKLKLAESYKYLGLALLTTESSESAIAPLQKGLAICEERKDPEAISLALSIFIVIASVHKKTSKFHLVRTYERAIQLVSNNQTLRESDYSNYFECMDHLMVHYFLETEYKKATDLLNNAKALIEKVTDKKDDHFSRLSTLCMSEALLKMFSGNYMSVLESFIQAINAINSIKTIEELDVLKKALHESAKAVRSFEHRHELFERFISLVLSCFNFESQDEEDKIMSEFYLLYVDSTHSTTVPKPVQKEIVQLLQALMRFILKSLQDDNFKSVLNSEVYTYFKDSKNRKDVITLLNISFNQKPVSSPPPLLKSSDSFAATEQFWRNSATEKAQGEHQLEPIQPKVQSIEGVC